MRRRTVIELDDMYVVQPAAAFWFGREWVSKGAPIDDDFRYVSNTNSDWLNVDDISKNHRPFEIPREK
jgi:UDP-N-acetylglucosamine 4,6-dehydratase